MLKKPGGQHGPRPPGTLKVPRKVGPDNSQLIHRSIGPNSDQMRPKGQKPTAVPNTTYQGLQGPILLQGVLERGGRVWSVVHGVFLIGGHEPAGVTGGSLVVGVGDRWSPS